MLYPLHPKPNKKKPKQQYRTLEHASAVYKTLQDIYGEVSCPLHHKEPHELAIAVILSAQCTDERVNQITPKLFETFPTLESFAKAKTKDLEKLIFSTGFYHNKTKSIIGFAKMVLENYGGKIPDNLPDATKLPGFGRKTANVVISELYRKNEGFVVDTHVKRLANRLGLVKFQDPIRIEKEIMAFVPSSWWRNLSLYLIFLGRQNCKARKPLCQSCPLLAICPSSHAA